MASIATGDSHGRRAVDHEIPLVPFIDLLLCCIMFLLVTAVWNQLSRVEGQLDAPGGECMTCPPPTTGPLMVRITHDGFQLSTDAGDQTEIPRGSDGTLDRAALHAHLVARRRADPNRDQVVVMADDGIDYAQLITTMDTFSGSGYEHVTVTGG